MVGAPVANRAWILPRWFECLEAQTLRPDEYRFVVGKSTDGTAGVLRDLAKQHEAKVVLAGTRLPTYARDKRNTEETDPHRAQHMADLRNELRREFLKTDADVFVSLDTDILLEDPTVLERLVAELYGPRAEKPRAEWGWDAVAACTSLHPTSPHCYNAGWWRAGDRGDPHRIWERADENVIALHGSKRSAIKVSIPMAVFAIHRWAMLECRYKAHECGEDLGFADALDQRHFRVGWRPDLKVRHVWDELALRVLTEPV